MGSLRGKSGARRGYCEYMTPSGPAAENALDELLDGISAALAE
jgi:hypothetical protein